MITSAASAFDDLDDDDQGILQSSPSSSSSDNPGLSTAMISKETTSKKSRSSAGSKSKTKGVEPVKSSVSWLVSFPNSGTTYTIHNTEHVSMRSTATNYLSEVHYGKKNRIPVRPNVADNIKNGPWQRNNTLPMPAVTLTKTHCTGYDDRAPMQSSIISTARFLQGCRESSQYANNNDERNKVKVKSFYNHKDIVVSVIHLIRNPFDNIISRMHHGMKSRRKTLGLSEEQAKTFMSSERGVNTWCSVADRAFWMETKVPKNITKKGKLRRKPWDLNILLKIPCHSELFRYVEWHNAALRMIQQEKFRSIVVYYEDYETNYNATVDSILDFLDLTREAEPLPFSTGKTYRDVFFSPEVQEATKDVLQVIASKELWQILKRYFPSPTTSSSVAAK